MTAQAKRITAAASPRSRIAQARVNQHAIRTARWASEVRLAHVLARGR